MTFFKEGSKQWRLQPFPPESFSLYFQYPPNRFMRFMQRLLLGFKWTKE